MYDLQIYDGIQKELIAEIKILNGRTLYHTLYHLSLLIDEFEKLGTQKWVSKRFQLIQAFERIGGAVINQDEFHKNFGSFILDNTTSSVALMDVCPEKIKTMMSSQVAWIWMRDNIPGIIRISTFSKYKNKDLEEEVYNSYKKDMQLPYNPSIFTVNHIKDFISRFYVSTSKAFWYNGSLYV